MSDADKSNHLRGDPFTVIFMGLVATVAGVLWFLISRGYIESQNWWPYAICGLGCALIMQCFLARWASSTHRKPMFGRLLLGMILVCVGIAIAYDIREWWPLIPVIVGAAITFYGVQESRTSSR